MHKDDDYVRQLESFIQKILKPIRDVPFRVVVKGWTGYDVIPFDSENAEHSKLLENLKQVAVKAGLDINKNGINKKRSNEVGNAVEAYVREALNDYGCKATTPRGKSGKSKAAGYPDIMFYFDDKPYYLECKTYNINTFYSKQRSFYFSLSDDPKINCDAVHLLLSYEIEVENQLFKCRHYKILSLEDLLVDLKLEFNSDNRRLYSGNGARVLAEGDIIHSA